MVPNITNWFLGLVAWASSLVAICGGVKYIFAKGNKEKENRAGKMFMYGLAILLIIGFIFVILSVTTPSPFVRTIL